MLLRYAELDGQLHLQLERMERAVPWEVAEGLPLAGDSGRLQRSRCLLGGLLVAAQVDCSAVLLVGLDSRKQRFGESECTSIEERVYSRESSKLSSCTTLK